MRQEATAHVPDIPSLGNVADGRLQRLEQVRVPAEEVGVRQVGAEAATEEHRGVQGRPHEQAQARCQGPGWPDTRKVTLTPFRF